MNLVDLFAILPFVLDLIIGGLQVSLGRVVARGEVLWEGKAAPHT